MEYRPTRDNFDIPVPGYEDQTINGEIHYPADAPVSRLVILIPGFLGYVGWGFYPHIVKKLVKKNFTVVSFNHSTGGSYYATRPYTKLKNLEQMSIQRDIDDIGFIIHYIKNLTDERIRRINYNGIILVGHSKGGGIAGLYAANDRSVKIIVSINGISDFIRVPKEKVDEIIEQGFKEHQIPGTMVKIKVDKKFWMELVENPQKYSVPDAYKKSQARCLFVQGTLDDKVDPGESVSMHEAIPERSELWKIDGMDHNLGCNPVCFPLPPDTDKLVDDIIAWIVKRDRGE
ncbi:MAG: prolyl oligopeptidase family serine peptidase [Acidobacteria bacterium]|nr:prolyl oligopeptidase family serine peptidase [Acidobacteriota bacterium]